jgi:hypothetical protein
MYVIRRQHLTLAAAALLLALVATPAAAQCNQFLCYVDLDAGGGTICPNSTVFPTVTQPAPPPAAGQLPHPDLTVGSASTTCTGGAFRAVVVQVDVPAECSGVAVWVEYQGDPDGWSVNIGDSITDNGFGGDSGSLPAGQNAEVEVLDELVRVWSAADNPSEVDALLTQHLALHDGAMKFVVQNQYLSWGQQYTALETPDLERLFFLPSSPVAPENRTIWVGLNRTVGSPDRNGCGARRALIHVQ